MIYDYTPPCAISVWSSPSTCIYKPGKDRGNAFIHRNGDAGILSLRDCASLRNQREGRGNDKNSRREVFAPVFKKKKKKERTAHFLHANDDNCFPTAPLCDIIFSTLYIFCLSEQRANRKIIERCRLLWVHGFRFRSLSLSRWILITRVHSIGNDCHFKFYCCIQRCVNFFSVQRESFLYRKLLIRLFQFYVINYYLSK